MRDTKKSVEICNGTELSLDELNNITFDKVSEESALGVSAITYINKEYTIVKRVWHDGMTEYYYTYYGDFYGL